MIDVRRVLRNQLSRIKAETVAVPLSGGIDSTSVALTLRDLGKTVVAYSFTLADRTSWDYRSAQKNAKTFGFEFRPIILPTDLDALYADIVALNRRFGVRKKTEVECTWPMAKFFEAIVDDDIKATATGTGADGHFCISKKGMIHYRDTRIDEFRRGLFVDNPGYAQKSILLRAAREYGVEISLPYLTDEMHELFLGTTWREVNRPKQKQPIIDAYPEDFAKMEVKPHTNLQLGDSGIAALFASLLDTDYNTGGWKSPVGLYNAIDAKKNAPASGQGVLI